MTTQSPSNPHDMVTLIKDHLLKELRNRQDNIMYRYLKLKEKPRLDLVLEEIGIKDEDSEYTIEWDTDAT